MGKACKALFTKLGALLMVNKHFTNALPEQLLGCQVGSAHKRLSGGGVGMVAAPCLVALLPSV